MEFLNSFKKSISLLIFFTILTGLVYPVLVTLFAQTFFSWRANGSLISQNNMIKGSALLGQAFSTQKYFWGRPSATPIEPNNALASGGSNMAATNPDYLKQLNERVKFLRENNLHSDLIPVGLVTASASGLDPDISPLAARYQSERVAKARQLPLKKVQELITQNTHPAFLNFLGEPTVNILELNLSLDQLDAEKTKGVKNATS